MLEDDVVILIAEDDDGHAELIREQFTEAGVNNKIIRFCNGLELINFITDAKSRPPEGVFYLILLDIRMPVVDGIEVLKRIKSDNDLKNIPVIMLTTTDDPNEIEECYKIGCNCYITKPVDFIKFSETIKRLGLFIKVVKIAKV